jgi:uncharacterized protein (DUF2062 family)
MRLEHFPIILGALGALIGVALLVDVFLAGRADTVHRERRRRERRPPHRLGEAGVALGMLALSAALIGRDSWRYGTVAVLVGAVLLALGAALNARFLKEQLVFRGADRRQAERAPRPLDEPPSSAPETHRRTR